MTGSVFVDTSALYALFNPRDSNHAAASGFLRSLHAQGTELLTTNLVELEAYVLVHARMGRLGLLRFRKIVGSSHWLSRHKVTTVQEAAAWTLLERERDKEYSFVDASSFVVMRAQRVTRAFAFDIHFQQAGFQKLSSANVH